MTRRTWATLCACLLLLLTTGCASFRTMPFASPSEKVEDKKAVYLLMVTLENSYRPSFHPRLQTVVVDRRVGDKWEGNLISADLHGIVVVPGAAVNSYAARLELEPGEYVLRRLNANGMVFPIQGTFEVPLYANLSVREPTGVFYLGNVRATVREATEGERKAGPVIPLIDQAVAGASGGTFEVTITDAWRTDEAVFRSQFPALAKVPVRKAILPAWNRAKVKRATEK